MIACLDLDRMHVSQIASWLERDKLIARRPAGSDQRAKLVTLTDKGRDRLVSAMPVVEAYDQAFFSTRGARHEAFPDRTAAIMPTGADP